MVLVHGTMLFMRTKVMLQQRKQIIGNQLETDRDDRARIMALLVSTTRENAYAVDREQRIQGLMRRLSYRVLSPRKKAQASRRLLAASQLVSSSADLKEQLQHRLEQLITVS